MEIQHNLSSAKNMVVQFAFLYMVLTLWPIYPLASAGYTNMTTQPHCKLTCGRVEMSYPFRMTYPRCYMDKQFEIECSARHNSGSEKPFLKSIKLEVTEIDVNEGIVWIKNPIYRWNCTRKNAELTINMSGSPFVYSQRENKFVAVARNKLVYVQSNDSKFVGCASICDEHDKIDLENGFHGKSCCWTTLPMYLSSYETSFLSFMLSEEGKKASIDECMYATITVGNYFSRSDLKDLDYVPALLKWEIFNSSFVIDPNAYCYDTNITSSQKERSG